MSKSEPRQTSLITSEFIDSNPRPPAKRAERRRIRSAFQLLRDAYAEYFSNILNSKFPSSDDSRFIVIVPARPTLGLKNIVELHQDAKIFFSGPEGAYDGVSDHVMPWPGVIDLEEAEINRDYLARATSNDWELNHKRIVEVLEFAESISLTSIESAVYEAERKSVDSKLGPNDLVNICQSLAASFKSC